MNKLLFCLHFVSLNLFAQLETAQWRFGHYGALDFTSGSPVFVNSSRMSSFPWSGASIADSAANLLFYTNGVQIWNKNDTIMQNGIVGANPNAGSTQAALVFPKKEQKYYVVIANRGPHSSSVPQFINYAIVDMAANNGLGAVTATNQPISPPGVLMNTKLTGARHCNGRDYWLLAHEAKPNIVSANTNTLGGSRDFHAYRVTPDSIYTTPVISTIGSAQFLETFLDAGYGILKFSPNGRKVCCAYPNKTVEIFDFDNATGQVTNVLQLESISSPSLITWDSGDPVAYGVEFSPDGNRLYITYLNAHPAICQYDLAAGSASAIIASKTIIRPDTFMTGNCLNCMVKSLQLAPDGKIYVAEPGLQSVGVISNPNALGALCNYSPSAVSLGSVTINSSVIWAKSNYGLPSFISNYFEQKPTIPPLTGTMICGSASFSAPALSAFAGYSVTAWQWSFGDPLSGAFNTATVTNPNHSFSANGTYTVRLVLNYNCGADTLTKVIVVDGLPQLTVTPEPQICAGEKVTISFAGATAYSLNAVAVNQSSASIQPSATSVFTLTGSDSNTGCQSLKTFTVNVMPCTGVNEFSTARLGVMVYPNPHQGVFEIELTQSTKIVIADLSGRRVYTAHLQEGKHVIDISQYAKGFYFLVAENKFGSQAIKLVKE